MYSAFFRANRVLGRTAGRTASDVADDNPTVLAGFRTERDTYLDSLPVSPSSSDSVESDSIKDRLRSLG